MKTLFRVFQLLPMFIILLFLVNCSTDNTVEAPGTESDPANSFKLSSSNLAAAKAQWIAIQGSTAYLNHSNASKAFAAKLNGLHIDLATLKSRTAFQSWVTPLISTTLWPSVSSAMAQYDALQALGDTLNTYMGTFLNSLTDADEHDINFIFANPPVNYTPTGGPCQDGCELAYSDEMS